MYSACWAYGVNTPTVVTCILPTWCHWTWSCEALCTIIPPEPARANSADQRCTEAAASQFVVCLSSTLIFPELYPLLPSSWPMYFGLGWPPTSSKAAMCPGLGQSVYPSPWTWMGSATSCGPMWLWESGPGLCLIWWSYHCAGAAWSCWWPICHHERRTVWEWRQTQRKTRPKDRENGPW